MIPGATGWFIGLTGAGAGGSGAPLLFFMVSASGNFGAILRTIKHTPPGARSKVIATNTWPSSNLICAGRRRTLRGESLLSAFNFGASWCGTQGACVTIRKLHQCRALAPVDDGTTDSEECLSVGILASKKPDQVSDIFVTLSAKVLAAAKIKSDVPSNVA